MKTLSFQVFLMLMVAVPVEFQVTWEFWTKLQLFTGYKRTLKTLEVGSNAGNNTAGKRFKQKIISTPVCVFIQLTMIIIIRENHKNVNLESCDPKSLVA